MTFWHEGILKIMSPNLDNKYFVWRKNEVSILIIFSTFIINFRDFWYFRYFEIFTFSDKTKNRGESFVCTMMYVIYFKRYIYFDMITFSVIELIMRVVHTICIFCWCCAAFFFLMHVARSAISICIIHDNAIFI